MDDAIASEVAKQVSAERGCAVACSCGIHVDNATPYTIAQIRNAVPLIVEDILALLEGQGHTSPETP